MSALSTHFNATRALPTEEEVAAFCSAARDNETIQISRLLDTYGDDIINAKNNDGDTALILAAWSGHAELVSALIQKGADVNAKCSDNATALIWAAWQGSSVSAFALLDKGADVNARDTNGYTALIWAARKGSVEIVSALLDKGADIEVQNSAGTTALIAAEGKGHVEVAALLKQWSEQRTQKLEAEIEFLHNGIDHAVKPASRLVLRAPRMEMKA